MKNIDFESVGALLKKQRIEGIYPFRRGKFDITGFLLGLVLLGAIISLFVIFFGKFAGIYLQVKGLFGAEGEELRPIYHYDVRLYELLVLAYAAAFVFMTIRAITHINRQMFDGDGVRLYSAMPIGSTSLYLAKIITIYLSQFAISTVVVLAVNLTAALNVGNYLVLGWKFYVATVGACFILSLMTTATGSLFAPIFNLVKRFFKDKFLLNFLVVTAITGAAFYLYSLILDGVRQMLVGDGLKYFFDEKKMDFIVKAVGGMYPVKWIVDILLTELDPKSLGIGHGGAVAGLGIAGTSVASVIISLAVLKFMLTDALQSRNAGSENFLRGKGEVSPGKISFFALVKKDFLLIFRTPGYMFSYLSVAVVMPLMVYFCMTVTGSLMDNLVGLKANTELAIFLTLLFGALTNVFCATNISRDGELFYSIKAYPVGYKTIFFSKVFLCLIVTAISQLVNAITLAATGMTEWYSAIFVFFMGTAFGFVNICVATRYDFNHARFSTEEDGEITETGGAVSAIIILGLVTAFIVGGALYLIRVFTELKELNMGWLTYVVGGLSAIICGVAAYFYFVRKLDEKYYKFEGGEI